MSFELPAGVEAEQAGFIGDDLPWATEVWNAGNCMIYEGRPQNEYGIYDVWCGGAVMAAPPWRPEQSLQQGGVEETWAGFQASGADHSFYDGSEDVCATPEDYEEVFLRLQAIASFFAKASEKAVLPKEDEGGADEYEGVATPWEGIVGCRDDGTCIEEGVRKLWALYQCFQEVSIEGGNAEGVERPVTADVPAFRSTDELAKDFRRRSEERSKREAPVHRDAKDASGSGICEGESVLRAQGEPMYEVVNHRLEIGEDHESFKERVASEEGSEGDANEDQRPRAFRTLAELVADFERRAQQRRA